MSEPRPRRRVALLAGAGLLCLAGALVVGYLPSRVDGGVEPAVRRLVDALRTAGLAWVDYDVIDFVANVGFFVPIGLVAALLLRRRWWVALPLGAALSAALELGQYLFLPERYASATDVLANTLGTGTGALIAAAIRAARRREAPRPPAPPAAPR